ncbi:unnamed protein product [Dracunculus medinensis]|uniref:Tudor domain-containing protein n=1 Tax=Dracunculus medinensis TaxID=318479 RepID=A0A0N4UP86_DRAME|nr:unnamed protein product [Dracunculus medinensis]
MRNVDQDFWDDSLLIKMYDEARETTYRKLKNSSLGVKGCSQNNHEKQWKVGDRCLAPYEDSLYYEATISHIISSGLECQVEYDGYDGEYWVDVCELKKLSCEDEKKTLSDCKSDGRSDVKKQKEIRHESKSKNLRLKNYHQSGSQLFEESVHFMPSFIPPPLPVFNGLKVNNEDEALGSMLMSWYMSGYHSGYYAAIRDQKNAESCESSSNKKY